MGFINVDSLCYCTTSCKYHRTVFFSKNISSEEIVKMYEALGFEFSGNVAVKVHSGEKGNQNYLKAEMFKDIINHVNGTIVECNTAYKGRRYETDDHKTLLQFVIIFFL